MHREGTRREPSTIAVVESHLLLFLLRTAFLSGLLAILKVQIQAANTELHNEINLRVRRCLALAHAEEDENPWVAQIPQQLRLAHDALGVVLLVQFHDELFDGHSILAVEAAEDLPIVPPAAP